MSTLWVGVTRSAQTPRALPTSLISFSSSGNVPVSSFEYNSLPPTESSKQPPFEGIMTYRLIDRLYRGSSLAVKLTACGS